MMECPQGSAPQVLRAEVVWSLEGNADHLKGEHHMDTTKAEVVTRKHMQRVSALLGEAACELIRRASKHDLSKLEAVELEPLQRMQDVIDAEGQAPYGSDEYKRRTKMLGPMLTHHYENNSHHPEHYANGVDGMDLFDLIEMFFDWKAASERGEESSMNIGAACKRFNVSPQVEAIFRNTASRLEYKADALTQSAA
jgi:hypothetical protein